MSDQNNENQQTSPRQNNSPQEGNLKYNLEKLIYTGIKNVTTRKLLHRSENCVIYEETEDQIKRKLNKEHYLKNKGWKAPPQEAYLALGNFANVVAPFEYLQNNLPSVVQVHQNATNQQKLDQIETARNVRTVKKIYGIDNPKAQRIEKSHGSEDIDIGGVAGMVNTFEPSRVTTIIKENKELIQKLKESGEDEHLRGMNFRIGGRRQQNRSSIMADHTSGAYVDLTKIKKPQVITTNRLNTPGLQRLIQVGDENGIDALRKEIDDSIKRVRAAKKGAFVSNFSPQHGSNFFFPNVRDYFPEIFIDGETSKAAHNTATTLMQKSVSNYQTLNSLNKTNPTINEVKIIPKLNVKLTAGSRPSGPLTTKGEKSISIDDELSQPYLLTTQATNQQGLNTQRSPTVQPRSTNLDEATHFTFQQHSPRTILTNATSLNHTISPPKDTARTSVTNNIMIQSTQKAKSQSVMRAAIKKPVFDFTKPRIPERFNELSMIHQQKLLSIVEQNYNKNPDEQNTQAARDDRASALETLKGFQTQGNRPIILSTLDLKPIKPYVALVALKTYNLEHHKNGYKIGHGDGSKSVLGNKGESINFMDASRKAAHSSLTQGQQQGNYFSRLEKDLNKMQNEVMQETEKNYHHNHHQLINPSTMHIANLGGHHKQKPFHQSSALKKELVKKPGNNTSNLNVSKVHAADESHSTTFFEPHPAQHHVPQPSQSMNINFNSQQQQQSPFLPRIHLSKTSLFKHLLSPPAQENEEEKQTREMQSYLNQMFEEDFVKEMMREDKKLFVKLFELFSRLDVPGQSNQQHHSNQQQLAMDSTAQSFGAVRKTEKSQKEQIQDIQRDELMVQTMEEWQELANKKLKMLIKIMKQMMYPNSLEKPELLEYDCVYHLKSLVKRFYMKKGQMAEKLFKQLDAIVVERPQILQQKKCYFFDNQNKSPIEDKTEADDKNENASPDLTSPDLYPISDDESGEYSPSQVSPTDFKSQALKKIAGKGAHKITQLGIEQERVRLQTEITRVKRYSKIAEKYSAPYNDVCQKLCDQKLDQSANCQYLMDYYKTLCEFGKDFSESEFSAIYQNMKDNNLLNEDALRCFLLILRALGLSVSSLQVKPTSSSGVGLFDDLILLYQKQQAALALASQKSFINK